MEGIAHKNTTLSRYGGLGGVTHSPMGHTLSGRAIGQMGTCNLTGSWEEAVHLVREGT